MRSRTNTRWCPLSAYGKPYTPPKGKVDPSIDMKTPVRDQVNKMNAGDVLQAAGGADEGQSARQGGRADGRKDGEDRPRPGQGIRHQQTRPGRGQRVSRASQGWRGKDHGPHEGRGQDRQRLGLPEAGRTYGTDYLQRAIVTDFGLGCNRPKDAVYPTSEMDGTASRTAAPTSTSCTSPRARRRRSMASGR